jgi:hypothetical protein
LPRAQYNRCRDLNGLIGIKFDTVNVRLDGRARRGCVYDGEDVQYVDDIQIGRGRRETSGLRREGRPRE